MTPDELKSIPKGQFVVMKPGSHPMRTRLRLFLDWGITFGEPYLLEEKAARTVAYANKEELEDAVFQSRVAMSTISEQSPPTARLLRNRPSGTARKV